MEAESVNASRIEQLESLKSMQSTIHKLESALSQMTESGANTTLVKKRLLAVNAGLAVLEKIWENKPYPYTPEESAEARKVLVGLISSVENSYARSKAGSPQRTLLERRLRALKQAVQATDNLSATQATDPE
ncbi:hypothetical protein R70723_21035 [Paenibacillus sp. FSL R7-0273]|uniref:hypothetical protein n=1 Tax=Paenibacillus sp. FSL R7-0273 TaxID=1536772 RepID=UPI0004F6CE9C|nr:hypothetical protein [Paenibacillus sp. FSL R7-0273]AIQ48114.1 hypothetical protein R70723_21035 [Paenibacillus sp. FSL R7-0273]OMF91876.1 hypothetical protein BK144_14105 [Paenibacillus sp. FSL R7-0273]